MKKDNIAVCIAVNLFTFSTNCKLLIKVCVKFGCIYSKRACHKTLYFKLSSTM